METGFYSETIQNLKQLQDLGKYLKYLKTQIENPALSPELQQIYQHSNSILMIKDFNSVIWKLNNQLRNCIQGIKADEYTITLCYRCTLNNIYICYDKEQFNYLHELMKYNWEYFYSDHDRLTIQ